MNTSIKPISAIISWASIPRAGIPWAIILWATLLPVNVQAQSCVKLCNEDFLRAATAAQIQTAIAKEGITARDKDGFTPLHTASGHGPPENVTALLVAGANIEAHTEDGQTPFDLAKNNDKIIGTDAYWQLNEAQFPD